MVAALNPSAFSLLLRHQIIVVKFITYGSKTAIRGEQRKKASNHWSSGNQGITTQLVADICAKALHKVKVTSGHVTN